MGMVTAFGVLPKHCHHADGYSNVLEEKYVHIDMIQLKPYRMIKMVYTVECCERN